jgi:phenylpropionate dioxygenase-like ring-hydroxylating dioxygenase large terminal subunit
MTEAEVAAAEELSAPVTIGVEAYLSEDYARAERDKLWRKVWQQVGRVEDLPKVGSYLTYNILDDSIVVVRSGPETFSAHHNVCMHRGRRLVDIPDGAKSACGHKKSFVCGFHGWTYGLDGRCIHIPERQDWQDALTPENTHLAAVNVDTWGGWIWINMDPDSEPLRDYLEPAATMLDPFGLPNMRCKWRKWLHFQCNWKVAMEAFNETYHVATTHPQFNKFSSFRGWAVAHGKHSNIGYDLNSCIFEAACYELYPEGEEPQTEWVHMAADDPGWRTVFPQDFANMAAVQQGMKSLGFNGTKPNPYMECSTANLHRNLAEYLGTGAPRELKKENG